MLEKMQSKFMKRIVGVSYSTCTSFTFLELGVLPIRYEIHIRQLSYLHKILNLEEDDPVVKMFRNMQVFSECGEGNWWTDVSFLLTKYNIGLELEEIKGMGKARYKRIVKKCVYAAAFKDLLTDCHSKKKTKDLKYSTFKTQSYMLNMFPSYSKTVFKCRSQNLDIKKTLQNTEPRPEVES